MIPNIPAATPVRYLQQPTYAVRLALVQSALQAGLDLNRLMFVRSILPALRAQEMSR